jgi:FKBP-type peptidyl-prolyl cis-trans isomerase FkpA
MYTKHVLTACIAICIIVACKPHNYEGYSQTASGFYYKITKVNTPSDSVLKNNIIKVQTMQYIDDSLLHANNIMPTYIKLNDSIRTFDFPEILHLMHIGDSAVCMFPTKVILAKSNKDINVPGFLKKGKHIVVRLKVLQQFTLDSLAKNDFEKEKASREAASALIDKEGLSLAAKRFDSVTKTLPTTCVKLRNGVFVNIIEKGNGKKIMNDDEIDVSYKGFLDNGKFFEATTLNKPYTVHIGHNESIEGFEAGIACLTIGDSAHIYVPSTLAYGKNAAGENIPKYSNLVFKVRVFAKK